ncbi:MAG: GFA family protein [Dongiaceae bacterium]|jgi:hypothetical protein
MTARPKSPDPLTGRCLCGAITLEIRGPVRGVVVCHCRQCIRQHGAPPGFSQAAWENVRLTGEENLTWYASSAKARRGFCRVCGSSLFWEPVGTGRVSFTAGLLDQPTGLETVRHIFVADKSDYYEIHDDLEKFPGTMQKAPPI